MPDLDAIHQCNGLHQARFGFHSRFLSAWFCLSNQCTMTHQASTSQQHQKHLTDVQMNAKKNAAFLHHKGLLA